MRFCWILFFALVLFVVTTATANEWRDKRGGCPSMCKESKASKACGMKVSKFWYNVKTKSCEPFVYEGCGGNENRFGSKGLCEKMCKSKC